MFKKVPKKTKKKVAIQLELPIEELANTSILKFTTKELEKVTNHRFDLLYQLEATDKYIEVLKQRKSDLENVGQ